jgi:hypothetical protein
MRCEEGNIKKVREVRKEKVELGRRVARIKKTK